MRRQLVALAALCAAFTFAGSASALDVGVTEDEGNTNPDFVYASLQDLGMTTNVMSIRWNPLDPLGLPANFNDIRNAASIAATRGVSIILATYQDKNTGITDTPNAPAVFAQWLQKVAQECPLCARKVIVLNEPNLQFFFKPTFSGACQPSSPAAYAQVLAAAYDTLKAVDPTIRVYGLGLSPRGNDNCNAVSNVSMSPVYFLSELGKAYKAMGRDLPLMDALSFHPYPNANNQGPEVGYPWPNIGVPNLDRLKQAFYDAFAGTAQPLIGVDSPTARVTSGATAARATIALDEYGIQVDTQGGAGYTESENVPAISEATQADWYADVIARYACDPSVETLNFFHLRDEADRRRFQSGLLRLDGSQRPSYAAVKAAIAANKTCQGVPVSWRPAKAVIGAKAIWPAGKKFSKRQSGFRLQLTAEERATYEAELLAVSGGTPKGKKGTKKGKGKKLSAAGRPVKTITGDIRAYFKPFAVFKGKLAPGTYRVKVTITALMNPGRTTTLISPAFTVK